MSPTCMVRSSTLEETELFRLMPSGSRNPTRKGFLLVSWQLMSFTSIFGETFDTNLFVCDEVLHTGYNRLLQTSHRRID
jgi:hypothetical protein